MAFFEVKSDYQLGREAAEHVTERGVNEIPATIQNEFNPFTSDEFKDGFRDWLEDNND